MSRGLRRSLAWGSLALSVALVLATVYVMATLPSVVPAKERPPAGGFTYFLVALGFSVVGAYLASRRDGNLIAWIACGIGLAITVSGFGIGYPLLARYGGSGRYPGATVVSVAGDLGWLTAVGLMVAYLPLLFPDGRLLSTRWRPVLWLAGVDLGLVALGTELGRPGLGFTTAASVLLGIATSLFLAISAASIASLVVRYRRAGSVQRLQLKWFVTAALAVLIVIFTFTVVQVMRIDFPLADLVTAVAYLFLPISIAIAVLKYRLYDIDLVINRAVVFGALAAFITSVYVGIVVGIGSLVGSQAQPNLALSILATAVVAIAFQPVRRRVEGLANRLVYGYRATPYEVLTQFSRRVAGTYADEEVLPRLTRVLAEGTGAASASVWLRGDGQAAATWPQAASPLLPSQADRVAVVRHEGETLAELTVKKRAGEPFTPVEEKLLNDLAAQAGQVLRNVRLTSELHAHLNEISAQAIELRASRQRIVAVQDAERRRLERNIHDGAQQHLVALAVKLRLAATLAKRDPVKTRRSITELRAQTAEALQTLRDLAQGIYPPTLLERGLVDALRAHAEVGATGVGRYDPEVEAAVYFCCLEAVQNATKHARASRISVNLQQVDGHLQFSVVDDGVGFDLEAPRASSGLQNMQDRVAAVGGSLRLVSIPGEGTTVSGRLPVRAVAGAAR